MRGSAKLAPGVAALMEIGRPAARDERGYSSSLGLADDDVPAFVELARRWLDDDHFETTGESPAMWAPVHAWRALGELRAQVVVPMFLEMLDELDRRGDDWFLEEFPPLCVRIGASAVGALASYLADATHTEYARTAAAHGLQRIAEVDPSVRDAVAEALAAALRPLSEEHPDLNAYVIHYLTTLEAIEHVELIERAFASGVVQEYVCGDWAQFAFELGVGPEPPRRISPLGEVVRAMAKRSSVAAAPTQPPPTRSKVDKAARKRQRDARKRNRRR